MRTRFTGASLYSRELISGRWRDDCRLARLGRYYWSIFSESRLSRRLPLLRNDFLLVYFVTFIDPAIIPKPILLRVFPHLGSSGKFCTCWMSLTRCMLSRIFDEVG
jgi:hypothetical protein